MIRPRSRPHLPRHSRIKSACTLRNKHPCTLVLSRPSTSISTHQPTSGTLKTCKSARSHTQVATLSPSTAPNRAGTNLKRFDHINKALLTTRNPPQIPVRGIKPQPSRVDCKVLSAQMACKENQQRCDPLHSCTARYDNNSLTTNNTLQESAAEVKIS